MAPSYALAQVKRLDASKQMLEDEIKEMKRTAGQAVREAQLDKNSTAQQLYELREASERRQQALAESLAAAELRATGLDDEAAKLRAHVGELQRGVMELERQLMGETEEREELQAAHMKVWAIMGRSDGIPGVDQGCTNEATYN